MFAVTLCRLLFQWVLIQIKKGYIDFKRRGVKIRFITEITKENIPYCKELMQYVELRHMEKLKEIWL